MTWPPPAASIVNYRNENGPFKSRAELKKVPSMPGSLTEACDALAKDHEFLLKGDVFTQDVVETWIEMKRKEQDQIRLRPHPWEFHMYYDC